MRITKKNIFLRKIQVNKYLHEYLKNSFFPVIEKKRSSKEPIERPNANPNEIKYILRLGSFMLFSIIS